MSLSSRLARAKIVVDDDTRRGHLAAIDNAIETTRRPRGHGRALAVGLAVVLLVPVVALAAERSVPGDFLYPVRQLIDKTLEPSRSNDESSIESARRLFLFRLAGANAVESQIGQIVDTGDASDGQSERSVSTVRDQSVEQRTAVSDEVGDDQDRVGDEVDPGRTRTGGGDDDEPETRPTTTTFPESGGGDRQPGPHRYRSRGDETDSSLD